MITAKHLRIRFDKIDGFIRVYDGSRYLVLFGPEKYDLIYKRIRYLVGVNSGVTSVTTHNFAKCRMYLIYFV